MKSIYRKGLFLIIVIFSHVFSSAQEYKNNRYRIGITSGAGYYSQDDLEKLNQEVQSQLEFQTEMIDNFPAHVFLGSYFFVNLSPQMYAGLNYEFHTTGSRLGIKDYSGSYAFDQILSCHSLAFEVEESLTFDKKPALCLDVRAGVNFATWQMKEEIIIGEQKESSSYKFKAIRPFIFPSLKLKYPLLKRFCISASVGYLQELFGKYKLNSSKGTESNLVAKFSGPRASIGFDYSF